jgi:hypothetical protein
MNISVSAKRLGLLVSALMLAPGAALAADEPPPQAKPEAGGMMGHDQMEGRDKMMPAPKGKMNMGSSCMSMSQMQKMGMSKKKMDQMKHNCGSNKKKGSMSGSGKAKPAAMAPH